MITRKVKIVEANDQWAEDFRREQEKLHNLLGDIVTNIHHIGSTSVPNLAAKPIIDILLEVSDLQHLTTNPRNSSIPVTSLKASTALQGGATSKKAAITARITSMLS